MPVPSKSRPDFLTRFFQGPDSGRLPDGHAIAFIAAFFVCVFAVATYGGNFPQNDDWTYGESVRVWLESGKMYMPTSCAAALAHIFYGVAVSKIFGLSYVALRFSTVAMGFVGTCLLYLTMVEAGIHRRNSLFCALLYAGNPIMINLYLGFMSDVTALTLGTAYFYFLLGGIRKSSLKHLALALVMLLLSITVRQSAVILSLASLAILFSRLGSPAKRMGLTALFIGLSMASMMAVDGWLMQRVTNGEAVGEDYALARLGHKAYIQAFLSAPLQQLLKSLSALGVVGCYLGLFAAPLLIAQVASRATLGRHWDEKFAALKKPLPAAAALAALALCLLSAYCQTAVQHALMPFCENLLRFTSVGASTIMGLAHPLLSQKMKVRLTVICYVLAFFIFWQFAYLLFAGCGRLWRLFKECRQSKKWPAANRIFPARLAVILLSLFAALGFLAVETVVRCTDRYYLIALLPAIMAMAYCSRMCRLNFASQLGVIMLLAGMAYGLCAGQDYVAANSARWRGLAKLERQGIDPARIDGGSEYNVLHDINVYAGKYRGEPPRNTWRWWTIRGEDYVVSFSPVPEYEEKWEEKYFSFLTMSEQPIYVLEKMKLNK